MRRPVSDINHHIKHFALNHTAKLGLRMPDLIVQSTQGVPDGSGVIVLNESVSDSQLGKLCLVIALEEEPAVILEH